MRGVFCCIFGLKNCPFYEKSTFFLKKSGKNFVVSKKSSTFAPLNNKNIYNNEKEKHF